MKMLSFGTFLTLLTLPCFWALSSNTVVLTKVGQIRGLHVKKSNKFNVNQYLGVPYALPPIGTRRFRKPQSLPIDSSRIIDATKFAPTCVQPKHMSAVINSLLNVDNEHQISEDCLYLNIYVPNINDSKTHSLPVMVWFTGEGFDFGDARQFDGTYLASLGKVIVVTVQYRVGLFGFLNDEQIASGNMGLWDQVEALRWVKKNIQYFGGNKDSITVFGRFSGSMSISYLLASPILRYSQDLPLFKRAILMSGIAVGDWTLERKPFERSNQFIRSLGCDKTNVSKCLMEMDSEYLLSKAPSGWKPSVDSVLIEEEPLKVFGKKLFAKGIKQVMIGSTENEGSLCLLHWYATQSPIYSQILNNNLNVKQIMDMVKEDIKLYKTGDGEVNYHNFERSILSNSDSFSQKYVNFCSSLLVHSPNEKLISILSNTIGVETISYKLQYKPSFSIAPSFLANASHGDDVLLAFGLVHSKPYSTNSKDISVSSSLIKLISTFTWEGKTAPICPKDNFLAIKSSSVNRIVNYKADNNSTTSCRRNTHTLFTLLTSLHSKASIKTSISS